MNSGADDLAATPDNAPPQTSPTPVPIVFFATQLYPLAMGERTGFGGAETEMWTLARALSSDQNFDLRVLTLAPGIPDTPVSSNPTVYPVQPPPALTYQDSWIKRRIAVGQYYFNFFRTLRRQRAKIYYAKLASGEASIVWLAARITGAKFVFRIEHDWETNLQDMTRHIFRGRILPARFFIHCLKRADLVIVQTTRQATALTDNFGIKTTLIPNGHPLPDPSEIESRFDQRKSVLWVGRAHPMKRPHLFLDLASRFPQHEFVMIMPPEPNHPDLFREVQQQAASLPNLALIPGVAASEINQLYRLARLFVLTSEAEGFSNVVIEAMKNGCPVITYDHNPNEILTEPVDAAELPPAPGYCIRDDINLAETTTRLLMENEQFWQTCHATLRETVSPFALDNILDTYRNQFLTLALDAR